MLFHIEWVCRKTAGNVNRPPYRYTAVTHWACPPSSDNYLYQTFPRLAGEHIFFSFVSLNMNIARVKLLSKGGIFPMKPNVGKSCNFSFDLLKSLQTRFDHFPTRIGSTFFFLNFCDIQPTLLALTSVTEVFLFCFCFCLFLFCFCFVLFVCLFVCFCFVLFYTQYKIKDPLKICTLSASISSFLVKYLDVERKSRGLLMKL